MGSPFQLVHHAAAPSHWRYFSIYNITNWRGCPFYLWKRSGYFRLQKAGVAATRIAQLASANPPNANRFIATAVAIGASYSTIHGVDQRQRVQDFASLLGDFST
jgi:hypothetical protein